MNTPTVSRNAACTSGAKHELADMRRADLLFAFGDQHQVHRHLLAGAADRVQRGEERRLRALLVDRAAADDHLAEAGLVDELRFERRRRPFGGVELLHVVHEVEADGLRRAGIERREHAGLAVGVDDLDLLESGIARELRHVLGAFARIAVLGGDRRQRDPVLQPLDRFVVALGDLALDRGGIRSGGGRWRPGPQAGRRW